MKACWPDDGPNTCAATSCHTGRSIERHRAGVADAHRHLAVAAVPDSRGSGIEVTQATLSRDLDEIHATKTRLADGTVAYALGRQPEESASANPDAKTEQQMNRVLSGLVTSVAAARNLVVVHTPSGAAQYVASVIDKQPIDGVLGTIAGDDTVMVICADDDYAKQRAQWLLDVVSKG